MQCKILKEEMQQRIARLLDKHDALHIEMKENLAVMSPLQKITLKLLAGAEQLLSVISAPGCLGASSSSINEPVPGVQVSSTFQSKKPTMWTLSNNNSPYCGLLSLFLMASANSGNK